MKKIIIGLLLVLATALSFGQFSANTLVEGHGGQSKVGLTYSPIKFGNVQVGLFGGVNGQRFGDWLQKPNELRGFGKFSVGPLVTLPLWQDKRSPLYFGASAGYLVDATTDRFAKDGRWSWGLNLGWRF